MHTCYSYLTIVKYNYNCLIKILVHKNKLEPGSHFSCFCIVYCLDFAKMCIFWTGLKLTKVPEPQGAFYLAQFSGLKFLKFSMWCSTTRLKMNVLYKWLKWKVPFHSVKMIRAIRDALVTRKVKPGGGSFCWCTLLFLKPFCVQEFFLLCMNLFQCICLVWILCCILPIISLPPALFRPWVVLGPKYPQGLAARKTNICGLVVSQTIQKQLKMFSWQSI